MKSDTIAAIATPIGLSSIGVIRVSGPKAFLVLQKIFFSKSGKKKDISKSSSHCVHFGIIKNKKDILDEVLVVVMKGPNSYTGDNTVEINCHGNPLILSKILDLVNCNGARLAQPGEFTRQAFLNGKLDLTQAEAVMDVISSRSDKALQASLRVLQGEFSNKIQKISDNLKEILMYLEADIDFPEDGVPFLSQDKYIKNSGFVLNEIQNILSSFSLGSMLREGLYVVLTGYPNTGKSSLFNALLKISKAIVTDIPGTTRDALECKANFCGIPCNIIDTAGIHEGVDIIEQEGIRRAKEHLKSSHVIVFLVDGSREIYAEEKKFFKELIDLEEKYIIVAINKVDLAKTKYLKQIKDFFIGFKTVEISAKKLLNIQKLEEEIIKSVGTGSVSLDIQYMLNARHKDAFLDIEKKLNEIKNKKIDGAQEIIAFHIKEIMNLLGKITGQTVNEEILDMIFSRFCIGK